MEESLGGVAEILLMIILKAIETQQQLGNSGLYIYTNNGLLSLIIPLSSDIWKVMEGCCFDTEYRGRV